MHEAFACPDCGTAVEIQGLAPGRQVHCEFCHRLLEVPYFRRVDDPGWKRRRYRRPWWVIWAWSALGLVGFAIVVIAGARFVDREKRASLTRSIDQLVAAAKAHEQDGNTDQAVVDLDTAIQLGSQASGEHSELLVRLQSRRHDLSRRSVLEVMTRLQTSANRPFPLGDWLNLQARAGSDPDLASLQNEVETTFRKNLEQNVEAHLATARSAAESGNSVLAWDRCETLAPLAAHLPEPDRGRLLAAAGQLILGIVLQHGVVVNPPQGHFVAGSMARYNSEMIPVLNKMLKTKGYLPQPSKSAWRDHWSRAPYRLSLEVNEQHEGNYLASENRLTRIDARLKLLKNGIEIWNTTPTARTKVPLPNLPAYYSARAALSTARVEEFERLLYDSARSQIDEKFVFALSHMPECVQAGSSRHQ